MTDVFRVQGDIAGRVAQALDVALGANERKTLTEKPTENLAAYDAFLKGEEASQRVGVADPASLQRAIESYERAVALDSAFAPAWAELARTYAAYYFSGTPGSAGAS